VSREVEILLAIDEFAAALARFRAQVAALIPPAESNGLDDDLADGNLLDTHAAAARFGLPADCLRRWARETRNTPGEIGRRKGGRWLVSIPRLQRRINGGE
jgi:hypothetical protein